MGSSGGAGRQRCWAAQGRLLTQHGDAYAASFDGGHALQWWTDFSAPLSWSDSALFVLLARRPEMRSFFAVSALVGYASAADQDCLVTPWTAYAACSATCGGGSHVRSRSVSVKADGSGAACPVLTCSPARVQHPSPAPRATSPSGPYTCTHKCKTVRKTETDLNNMNPLDTSC